MLCLKGAGFYGECTHCGMWSKGKRHGGNGNICNGPTSKRRRMEVVRDSESDAEGEANLLIDRSQDEESVKPDAESVGDCPSAETVHPFQKAVKQL